MNRLKRNGLVALGALLMIPSLTYASPASCGGDGWNCYKKGMSYAAAGKYDLSVKELEYAVKAQPGQASIHSELAKAYEKVGKYQLASDHYGKQAEIYRKKGQDQNSYLAAKRKSDELNSTVEFYEVKPGKVVEQAKLGKYEPSAGAYIGAFIASESKYKGSNINIFEDFNTVTGKKHATFFDYGSIGSSLENSFMYQEDDLIAAGGAIHVGYEPNRGLDEVTEPVIRAYAEELAALEVPVFLRYASEMNGEWVPWHGDPAKYIQKWKMVHDIMAEVAPNVAMVWSPSEMPLAKMDAYYPGDAYVDWVGLSIYSAQFENGDPQKPTDRRNPLEALDYVYSRYASTKPIMISEYAASHQAGFNSQKQDTSKFAKAKMTYFYESIKTKYPRVKCIQWYSNNNYNISDVSKNRVNYSLLEGQSNGVLDTYKRIISDEYFLSDVVNGPNVGVQQGVPNQSHKINGTLQAAGDVTLRTWVKSYDPYISQVVYKLNGERIKDTTTAPYDVTVPFAKLKAGNNTLEAVVFDSAARVVKTEKIIIKK